MLIVRASGQRSRRAEPRGPERRRNREAARRRQGAGGRQVVGHGRGDLRAALRAEEVGRGARARRRVQSSRAGRSTSSPTRPPKIALTKDPERTRRGALKLDYTVEDDYGVVSAEAKVRSARTAEKKAADPAKDWARPEPLKGARLPLEHPPTLTLRLPRGNTHAGADLHRHRAASLRRARGDPDAGSRVTSPATSGAASRSASCCRSASSTSRSRARCRAARQAAR